MRTGYEWSNFRIRIPAKDGRIIIKSTLTGAVVRMSQTDETRLAEELEILNGPLSEEFITLVNPDVGLLVERGHDEYAAWRNRLVHKRDNEAHIFILHFLPTIQCQFSCGYCFENGGDRMKGMKDDVIVGICMWLDDYFGKHSEIDSFRLVLFGGEPLLRKDIIIKSLRALHSLADKHNLDFWMELTSNGELLDEETASMLAEYNWLRVQITLDGPEDVHDARRHGKNGRPTFQNVVRNIRMLLSTDYIERVDIRISLDCSNAEYLHELIRYLASFDAQDRINLSLGLITPTLDRPERMRWDEERVLSEKAIAIWKVAKECGFTIPKEFVTGPWCVAIAKHSAILQPNGALQKCFCTSGRAEYDFCTIADRPNDYLQDPNFEKWRRTDLCIEEKCEFLPMCGGGCIHDAMVAGQGPDGGAMRFCQKPMIETYNKGLLNLSY